MQISWHGLSCFEILAKSEKGEVNLVIDPFDNSVGLRLPRNLAGDIVAVTHNASDANHVGAVAGNPLLINLPGEYESKGIFIYSIALSPAPSSEGKVSAADNKMFRIEAEKMHVVHLGALNRELTPEELQLMHNVDILLVPVGGGNVLSPKKAVEVIEQVEPRVVIPMTYALPDLKEQLGTLEAFCKEMGACRKEELPKFKIVRKDLPEEDMLVVTLTP